MDNVEEIQQKIVIAGLGGQGVVFATRLLAETAMALGYAVRVSEVHGMSQRGGSVVSFLKIGPHYTAFIRQGAADLLLALDLREGYRNLPFIRPGGTALFALEAGENGLDPAVIGPIQNAGLHAWSVPAGELAFEAGLPAAVNVALIGFATALPGFPLPYDALHERLRSLAPRKVTANLALLEAGWLCGATTLEGINGRKSWYGTPAFEP